jgi:hypothetical protein
MDDRSAETARRVVKRHERLSGDRVNWDTHWQEIAERVLPRMSGEFIGGGFRTPGAKRNELMLDATAALGLERFASVLDSMITPQSSKWHSIRASLPELNRIPAVVRYFDETRDILFRQRYSSNANFVSQNLENWISLGAFGTGGMYVDRRDGGGLRYRAVNLAEWYFLENHQGQIDTAHRKFRMPARQIMQKFSRGTDVVPEMIRKCVAETPDREFELIHCIEPRADRDPTKRDHRGMAFASYYVFLEGPTLAREEGYSSFPLAVSRYVTAPGEVYGRSPAMMVLPNIKVLNEQKRTLLKVGHRLVDPIILAHDDGVLDVFSMKPGTQVIGGIDSQGRKLVGTLDMPTGQLPALDKLMEQERMVINDAFLVSLFQILVETPQMTATEVLERTREKGMLLAPTMGRQQSEYIGPLIERELDVLSREGMLPQMPPELLEAAGEYTVMYDSPLSRSMRAEEASGFMRWLETSLNVAAQTQDPSALDWVDFDSAQPELADILAVPNRWVATPELVAERRQGRQQQGQQQQLVQSLPGIAALAKAGVGAQL